MTELKEREGRFGGWKERKVYTEESLSIVRVYGTLGVYGFMVGQMPSA